jgi:hypothetical protein
MGAFFTNLHARAAATELLIQALRSAGVLPAFVSEPGGGWVSIYPEATENQDHALLERIAKALSSAAGTTVYASLVHDSDVWDVVVLDGGRLLDHYCSQPGYFSGRKRKASGGKVDALLPLCRAGTTADELEDLLKRHLTVGEGLPAHLAARLAAEMEKQKEWLASTYEEAKAGLAAQAAPMPSLQTMLKRLDQKTRKLVSGSGRADTAEDLARAFARMLGIPDGRAELGYGYISRGEAPADLARLISA